ncbi:HIV Tat-specific factor 1 homolog [Physella acuta]|uniref:HIV Tat-specific factor 1 homolog n=1 Tax=Physella acuta TaxID=109671 RepID=UPI0027DD9A6B|nr:HIV Tat-specific factor 1 homolog [Physella acuta]
MAEEEDEFEMQLRQEELARLAKEEGEALTRGITYTDDDGTVMEWDHERKAYFPKIDTDFIAKYQINYGTNLGQQQDESAQYNEFWKNYYDAYTKEQPPLPKPEEEEDEEGGEGKKKSEETSKKPSDENTTATAYEGDPDPTSEEHYQYNLYYYGKEYADSYREYYKLHPDAEALPDFRASAAAAAGTNENNKKDEKKGKKRKEEKGNKPTEPPREEGWFEPSPDSSTQLYVTGLPLDITYGHHIVVFNYLYFFISGWFEPSPDSSTQLYVTGLPLDITEMEFKELMSKCGLIMFDPQTQKPKIKLYKDSEGNMKGDGLCTYIKPESVTLALQIVDGMDLRGHTITVERAKFELKGQYDPKKKKKKLSNKAKQKLKERQQKLFDWRPDPLPFQRGKHEKTVILKNMFNIQEFETNPALINELRADVREECLKFGDVKKVILYDRNPEGVMSVTFKEPEEADSCIAALNGRWFAKNRVVATTWDGKSKYDIVETEEERTKRLQEWEAFLEGKKQSEKALEASARAGAVPSGNPAMDAVPTMDADSQSDAVPTMDADSQSDAVPPTNAVPTADPEISSTGFDLQDPSQLETDPESSSDLNSKTPPHVDSGSVSLRETTGSVVQEPDSDSAV